MALPISAFLGKCTGGELGTIKSCEIRYLSANGSGKADANPLMAASRTLA
jgi:hypothetical protein